MTDEKIAQYGINRIDNEVVRVHTPNGIIEITHYEHSQKTRIYLARFGVHEPEEITWLQE